MVQEVTTRPWGGRIVGAIWKASSNISDGYGIV